MDYAPHVVALPLYTGWQRGALDFCRGLKERINTTVVLGGPHPTNCPEIVKHDAVDYVCVGEGEVSFTELIARIQERKRTDDVPGIWSKNGSGVINKGASLLPDLTKLPHMDIDLYCKVSRSIRIQENREFSLNRGCPFNCHYCNASTAKALYGPGIFRSKTVDQAIGELRYVYDRYPFKSVMFTSDNLFLKKRFAFEFLDRYAREIKLPFYCQMRVELVSPQVARALRTAGCHAVSVGVESGSVRVRREILGRKMSNERIVKACRTLQDAGIQVNTYNMLAIPGETFEEALETVRLNAQIRPSNAGCSFFQPYPGTKMTEELIAEGRIEPDFFDKIPASFYDKSVIGGEDSYRFANLHRLFNLWMAHPQYDWLFRRLCEVKVPRIYDIVFLWTFYRYVRKSYKKSPTEALGRILTNAIQAWRA